MTNGFFNIPLTLRLPNLMELWSLFNGICPWVVARRNLTLKYSHNMKAIEEVATKINNNQPLGKITFNYM